MGRAAGVALAVLLAWAAPARAQLGDGTPLEEIVREAPADTLGRWKKSVELSANLFLGADRQTVLATSGSLARGDSIYETTLDARFVYGSGTTDGERRVTQRSWLGSFTLDLWPFARNSPFLLSLAESSYERRIGLRVSAGVGHKLTFLRTDQASASVSLALIGERTSPSAQARAEVDTVSTVSLVRWSGRVRAKRRIGDRGEASLETYYRPVVHTLDRFTATTTASASYRMTDALRVKLSYLDNYDSEAEARGARSPYEGQLLLGVQADF